jgi:hypothetical protein
VTDVPAAPPRPLPHLADPAVAVLVSAGVAALLVALVLGVRGFLLGLDTDATDRLCQTRDVSMGECLLAVADRRTAASTLLTGSGAAALGGVSLLLGGSKRSVDVLRRERAVRDAASGQASAA